MTVECKTKNIKRLVCIEYPGIVENVSSMLQTLNGINGIENTYNNESDRLELRFRPEDLYSHSTFGDRNPSNSLFVKFIRRKKSDGSYEYDAKIIGFVETCYQFKSLADFQYLPMSKTDEEMSNKCQYKSIIDELIPKDPFNVEVSDFSQRKFDGKAPLFVIPTIFSRFDSPIDYFYRNDSQHRDEGLRKDLELQDKLSIIGRTRKSRSILACLLNWTDSIPQEPTADVLKALRNVSQNNELFDELIKCFEERPIWSRNALVGRLSCERIDIKYLLPKIAYYFVNGPFRCMWIRFGYDPRIQRTAKIYQTLDFRVKQVYAKNMSSERIKAKRSIYQYQLPLKKREHEKLKSKQSSLSSESFLPSTSKEKQHHFNDDNELKDEKLLATYIFKPGLMPAYRQLFYQLCDINVEEVQEIIHSNDGNEPEVCDERDGWCARGSIDRIRFIMSGFIDKMLSKTTSNDSNQMELEDSLANEEEDDDNEDIQNDEFLEYYS